ncbi:unnamed protein product [Dicrocoelium dendriticum]|nr:unnamed protein product [Dicrocoelium dendriticum]
MDTTETQLSVTVTICCFSNEFVKLEFQLIIDGCSLLKQKEADSDRIKHASKWIFQLGIIRKWPLRNSLPPDCVIRTQRREAPRQHCQVKLVLFIEIQLN